MAKFVRFSMVLVLLTILMGLMATPVASAQELQPAEPAASQIFMVQLQDRAHAPVYEGSGEFGSVGIVFSGNSSLKRGWISLDLFEEGGVKVEGLRLYGVSPAFELGFMHRIPIRPAGGNGYLLSFLNEDSLSRLNSTGWTSLLLWADFSGSGTFSYAMSFVGTTMDGQTVRARVESRSVRVLPKGVLTVSLSPTTPIARTILSGGSEDGLVLKLCASYEPIYIDQLIVKGTTAVAMVGPVSHGVVWRNAPSESLVEYYVLEVGVITPGECLTLSLAVRAREIDGDRVKAGDLVQAWVVENRIHALGVNSREWVDPNTPELRSAPHTVVPREE